MGHMLKLVSLTMTVVLLAGPVRLAAIGVEDGLINVKAAPYSAVGDGVADDTRAIQAAWDDARKTGGRVWLPPGEYRISLRGDARNGFRPALHFAASAQNKEKQPMLEGADRGVTFTIAFPIEAPRTLEVVRIDKGKLSDNPRGMEFRNIRLVNVAATPGNDWRQPYDFRGTGIRVLNGWSGELLHNFQISGFYTGLYVDNMYGCEVSGGEIRDCNFGLYLSGTPNANTFRSIFLQKIRAAATNTEKLDTRWFPQGRIGACVYAGGGSLSGGYFENVSVEMCGVAGYFFQSAPVSLTVAAMRSESVVAPIWIQGPIAPYFTSNCLFLAPSIDCDSLVVPAIYLNRAEGYTFISPRFYQRHNQNGSRVAIEMTPASRGNLFLNPTDDGSGTTGKLADDIIDAGQGNQVQGLRQPTKVSASPK